MVAFELQVMAKKMDRFGWDRDQGTAAHDRIILDFMDALQDYPLDMIKSACREWVKTNPRRMPNEGDILAILNPKPKPETYAQRILREYGGNGTGRAV